MTTTNTALTTTASALDRLNKSLAKGSLMDLVAAKTKRSLLLVDVSGSMAHGLHSGQRRIDALRNIVQTLRETHPVPVAAFGLRTPSQVALVDRVPEPAGGTPLDAAILFGLDQGATHLAVVTDGEPNSEEAAFDAARRFGGVIDVFFVGEAGTRGAGFARELAEMTGGSADMADLGQPRALGAKLRLCIGDGSESL